MKKKFIISALIVAALMGTGLAANAIMGTFDPNIKAETTDISPEIKIEQESIVLSDITVSDVGENKVHFAIDSVTPATLNYNVKAVTTGNSSYSAYDWYSQMTIAESDEPNLHVELKAYRDGTELASNDKYYDYFKKTEVQHIRYKDWLASTVSESGYDVSLEIKWIATKSVKQQVTDNELTLEKYAEVREELNDIFNKLTYKVLFTVASGMGQDTPVETHESGVVTVVANGTTVTLDGKAVTDNQKLSLDTHKVLVSNVPAGKVATLAVTVGGAAKVVNENGEFTLTSADEDKAVVITVTLADDFSNIQDVVNDGSKETPFTTAEVKAILDKVEGTTEQEYVVKGIVTAVQPLDLAGSQVNSALYELVIDNLVRTNPMALESTELVGKQIIITGKLQKTGGLYQVLTAKEAAPEVIEHLSGEISLPVVENATVEIEGLREDKKVEAGKHLVTLTINEGYELDGEFKIGEEAQTLVEGKVEFDFKEDTSYVVSYKVKKSQEVPPTPVEYEYKLVTSLDQLKDGCQVQIASDYQGTIYAATSTISSSLLGFVETSVEDGVITTKENSGIFTLTKSDDKWLISNDQGYLSSTVAKKVFYAETTDVATKWEIALTSGQITINGGLGEDGKAIGNIQFNYNNGSARFVPYTSNQTPIDLYVKSVVTPKEYSGLITIPEVAGSTVTIDGLKDGKVLVGEHLVTISFSTGVELDGNFMINDEVVNLVDNKAMFPFEKDVKYTISYKVKGTAVNFGTADNPLSVAELLEISKNLEEGEWLSEIAFVKGTAEFTKDSNINEYKNQTQYNNFNLVDGDNSIYVTRAYFTDETLFHDADEIVIAASVEYYQDLLQITSLGDNHHSNVIAVTHNDTYSVTIATGIEHGTVVLDDSKLQKAPYGTTITFTVTADENYKIEKVTINDVEIKGQEGKYSFLLKEDTKISASFVDSSVVIEKQWIQFTSTDTLKVGDQIIIAAAEDNFAMSTTQNNNNRGQTEISKKGNKLDNPSDNVEVLTLVEGTKEGTFGLKTKDGKYLYAPSSSSNQLKTENAADANGNANWKISFEGDVLSIVAQGTNTRNVMQYNSNNDLFACYGSASQGALTIYRYE